jgi:hypothetical protein
MKKSASALPNAKTLPSLASMRILTRLIAGARHRLNSSPHSDDRKRNHPKPLISMRPAAQPAHPAARLRRRLTGAKFGP